MHLHRRLYQAIVVPLDYDPLAQQRIAMYRFGNLFLEIHLGLLRKAHGHPGMMKTQKQMPDREVYLDEILPKVF